MGTPNYGRTKRTCYYTYLAMSSVFSLPPMLFVTFRELYGISYTLSGTLVLVNFVTQLGIDLIFTFFSKYFNIRKTVRLMPLLTSAGMLLYALSPQIFGGHVYAGLLIGTVLFSVSAGLSEVLLSPLIAAIPSENPDRDMSRLHSLYAYGVVSVVVISTVYFRLFGTENWQYLTAFLALLPIFSFVMFSVSPIPEMNISEHGGGKTESGRRLGLALCVVCIFLGGATENAMTNWVSGFAESALKLPKAAGDILGMALFAVLLGLGRTLYTKYGKNISRVLLLGMLGSVVCYLTAGLSPNAAVSLIACVMTGFCTSMLWPGTLILMEEKFPRIGVAAYALMAAGGDFGGSVAPQALGIIVDKVTESGWAAELAPRLSLTAEQIGMKTGIVFTALFPILGVLLLLYMRKYFSPDKKRAARISGVKAMEKTV